MRKPWTATQWAFLFAPMLAGAQIISAVHADPVLQQTFKFVDDNMGAGERPFSLSVGRDGGSEFAVLASADDHGNAVVVTFATLAEWQKFLGAWNKGKAALTASAGSQDYVPQVWDYTDSSQTKVSILLGAFDSLDFNISTPSGAFSMFSVARTQVPQVDDALTKVGAHFRHNYESVCFFERTKTLPS